MAKQEEDKSRLPLWIKDKGGGTFKLRNGYRVKPMEKFRAADEDIPKNHRDTITKIQEGADAIEKQEKDKALEAKLEEEKPKFYMEGRGGPWYDVKSAEGYPMNDKALKFDEADALLKKLNGEEPDKEETETKEE
jgi:hypothetical protein